MKIALISPYEIGRQPFGLAHPSAWLEQAGYAVECLDLAQESLDPDRLKDAQLIGFYLAMHTATRIAVEAIAKVREINPSAVFAAYGLYAPMNEALLNRLGVAHVFGGESEPDLLALAEALSNGGVPPESVIRRDRIEFITPQRSGLPAINLYAHLNIPGGEQRTVAFVESTRGCKHLCRHCPVVPVYEGQFRAVPVNVVMADLAQQVALGATHVSFGDPDFLNGPGHARRVLNAMHAQFPDLSFDATVKVEHIIKHQDMLPMLRDAGCLFLTSAVESVDEATLAHLEKGHTAADFEKALGLLRGVGIAMAPTFVPFSPWTTLENFSQLLAAIARLGLVEAVAPVQLAIRLLIPKGSWMLKIDGFEDLIDSFDESLLGYPWQNRDPAVDRLQTVVMDIAMAAEAEHKPRAATFAAIWQAAHAGDAVVPLPVLTPSVAVPALSEPWYCCAEPTEAQLAAI